MVWASTVAPWVTDWRRFIAAAQAGAPAPLVAGEAAAVLTVETVAAAGPPVIVRPLAVNPARAPERKLAFIASPPLAAALRNGERTAFAALPATV